MKQQHTLRRALAFFSFDKNDDGFICRETMKQTLEAMQAYDAS
jgi:Ca2+-binding EF-hand superfamily protein